MNIQELLRRMVAEGATDILFSAGNPPCMRVHGELRPFGERPVSAASMEQLLGLFLGEEQRAGFDRAGELDLSLTLPGVGRFRLNAYRQKGAVSVSMRTIMARVPTFEELHLPPVMARLAALEEGLVLIAGPSGSGKSTTVAAFVDRINQERSCHVVTVEEPIEYLHERKRSLVEQREVGSDTLSFVDALRHVQRQAPDVVVVSELPDLETIAAALKLAETGHLVLATMSTRRAAQTIDRLVEVFPSYQLQQVRLQLSWCLRAVVCQQLLPVREGRGVRPACEVMVVSPVIAEHIREGKSHLVGKAVAEGHEQGMVTMEAAIAELVARGEVAESCRARLGAPGKAGALPGAPAAGASPARDLERHLYDGDATVRRRAETRLKELEAGGDAEAGRILQQFSQFYLTNFEDRKIGLKR